MEFRKCYVNGISYGYGTTEIGKAADLIKTQSEPESTKKDDPEESAMLLSNRKEAQVIYDPTIGFDDTRLISTLRKGEAGATEINEFLLLLAVCHTVIPEKDGEKWVYRAASPDEEALVKAAKCLG